jgi:hypothetical protein
MKAIFRVPTHDLPLFFVQWAVLEQNPIRNGDLPEIVKQSTPVDLLQNLGVVS